MDYTTHFNLTDRPFKNTYNGKDFFPSEGALAVFNAIKDPRCPPLVHLKVTPKSGLTSILKRLPYELKTTSVKVALILNPHLTLPEIIRQILTDLGQSHKFDAHTPEGALLGYYQNVVSDLLDDDYRVLLAVDNAAELTPDTLGELYSLMELEPNWAKKVIILLSGLDTKPWPVIPDIFYKSIELKLSPLSVEQTESYIAFRLKAAGGGSLFTRATLQTIAEYSGGLPETINQLADRSLIAAWAKGATQVESSHLKSAIATLEEPGQDPKSGEVTGQIGRKQNYKELGKFGPLILIVVAALVSLMGIKYLTGPTSNDVPTNPSDIVVFTGPEDPSANQTLDAVPAAPSTTTGATNRTSPALPTPPPQLLNIPQGTLTLVVNQDRGIGRLWQGGAKGAGLKAEVATPKFKNNGLYIFGRPIDNEPIVFQFPPSRGLPIKEAKKIWPRVVTLLPQDLLPVIVASDSHYQGPPNKEAKEAILNRTKAWVQSQQYRFPDTMADLYAPSFQFFELGQAGRTMDREDFRQALKSEARTSGSVNLNTSIPLVMQDPERDNLFWAIFNLKYESKLRNDTGIRVLIFEKTQRSDTWLIIAELWLPEKSLKN